MKCFVNNVLLLSVTLLIITACGSNNSNYEPYVLEPIFITEVTPGQTPAPAYQPESTPHPDPTPGLYADVPFMWLVTSPHNGQAMYMFGAIHAATADLYPLSPIIMDAFHRSDYVALEGAGPGTPSMIELSTLADGRTIIDYIPLELYQWALDVLIEYENYIPPWIPHETIENSHPNVLMSTLSMVALNKSIIEGEYGIDLFFNIEAFQSGKEVLWIEQYPGLEHSLAIEAILSLPIEVFIQIIEQQLHIGITTTAVDTGYLYKAWRSGNDEALLNIWQQELDMFDTAELAALYNDAMTTRRRIHMANRASQFMAENKSVFFVVGAFHLIGDNSIIDLLEQRGYEVERVR